MMRSHEDTRLKEKGTTLTSDDVDPVETSKAWTRFLANRNAPSMPVTGVRPLIYKSWMRSNTTGIRPEQYAAPSLDNARVDAKRMFDQSEMRRATHACLHNMADLLAGAEAMLILTDKDGVILETVGDKSTLNKGGKINLSVGGVWSESASGTNGIGTALWMDKPVYVHGEEHFCEGMKAWSCAAAPIHDPVDQSIIGVINLSGLTSIFRKHNAAFAAALARDIEVSLEQAQSLMNFQLLEWAIGHAPRQTYSDSDGIAIIDRFGRLIFDRSIDGTVAGRRLPQKQGQPFLDLSGGISEAAILAALPSKLICKDIELIELDGTVKGASLIIVDQEAGSQRTGGAAKKSLPCTEVGKTGLKIVGRSDAILKALDTANSLLSTHVPAIIQGPTGVGKELFARLIHARATPAAQHGFETINCAGLTLEKFQTNLARLHFDPDNGVVASHNDDADFFVFDEIGELSIDLQPVLLRTLETIMARIQSPPSFAPPVRILSLTNRDLLRDIDAGNFRRDLYYRLGAIVLDIPPLRDRGEDILLIFAHYNQTISEQTGAGILQYGSEVEEALQNHDWPGNVRELRNAVNSLHCTLKTRRISIDDLPFNQNMLSTDDATMLAGTQLSPAIQSESLKDAEVVLIQSALATHHGNLTQTAAALGISRPTLYRKLKVHSIGLSVDKAH